MKAHTSNFKEQIKLNGKEIDSVITFGDTVLRKNDLNAVTPSFQSDILKSVMKQLDIDSNVLIPIGTILNYKFGVKVDGEYEYVDFGNYVIKEVERQEDTGSYKITCYDKMLFTMRDYVKMPITYPITIRDYINSLCTFLGLTFANKNDKFANYDKEIQNELYLNSDGNSIGYTFRDVFDELAQVTASTICINENDEVEIRYVGENKNYEETISNNSIVIKNNIGNNASSYNIKGKSEQETTSENLFASEWVQGNIDGSAGTDITATDTIRTDYIEIKPNYLYTLSRSVTTSYMIFRFYDKNKNFLGNQTTDGIMSSDKATNRMDVGEANMTFTILNENVSYMRLCDVSNDLTTIYTLTTNIPSPDYPSEIKTVKGIRNLFDKENYNLLKAYIDSTLVKISSGANSSTFYVECKPNTNYTISKKVSKRFCAGYMSTLPQIGSTLDNIVRDDTASSITLETDSNARYLVIWTRNADISGEVTEEEVINSLMIEEGTTVHDYVPYGAWANVKVTGKNLLNIRELSERITQNTPDTFEILEDEWIHFANTQGTTQMIWFKEIEVKANTNYSIYIDRRNVTGTPFCQLQQLDENHNHISITYPNSSQVITTNSNTKYIRFGLTSSNTNTICDYETIVMITKSDEINNKYETFKENELLIDMNKPNLFDKSSIPTVTDGATVEEIDTGVKIISTKNGQVGSAYYARYLLFNIENLAGKEITISSNVVCSSINHGAFVFGTCDSEENNRTTLKYIDQLTSGYHKMSVTLPNTITNTNKYLYVILYSNRSDVDSVAGDYVEYNNLKIYEGYDSYYELASIGNTKDNLEVVSGILTKRIGKVVLDGSDDETYVYVSSNSVNGYNQFNCTVNFPVPNAENYGENVISNHFKYYKEASTNLKEKSGVRIRNTNPYIVFSIENTLASTVADFKTWLSNNPVTVYYELAEPETIQLTPTNVPLFEGYNEVSLLDTIDTETSIEYQTEYDTIDEEYLKDVNVNFGEKYGPINSIVLSRAGESDNIYLQDEKSIEENGLCELKISENQIMNFNNRDEYLPDILEKLNGLEYYLNDFTSTGIAYYDVCDRYNVKIGDNIYSCVMFNDELLVTQGLQENVYTEMPEESETDYTKADKTDRRINQTYIIVDKQNQTINSLVNKIVDVSSEKSGTNSITLENAHEGQLHYLSIKGNISLLFPSSEENLYGYPLVPNETLTPSNNLVPTSPIPKDNEILYPSTELFSRSNALLIDDEEYKLDIDFLNYLNNTDCDEFIYEDGKCKIIRRLGLDENGELYKLDNEIIEPREDIILNIKSDSTIKMKSFENAIFKVIYLLENEYTNYFATNVEVKSSIEQTANTINLKVDQKLDGEEFTGANIMLQINKDESLAQINADKIDLSGKKINLTSDNISIKSNNFNVDENGNMTCNDATINGGTLRTANDCVVGNNLYVGQDQSSNSPNKFVYLSGDNYLRSADYGIGSYLALVGGISSELRVNDSRIQAMDGGANIEVDGNSMIYTDGSYISMAYEPVITSDERLKKDIKDIDVSWIDNIKIKEFEYKNSPGNKRIGVIAQDYIKEEYSKYFLDEMDGYYGVRYNNITNALIKYCQEMKEYINKLEQRIEELENER